MTIRSGAFGIAVGNVTAASFVACALFYLIAPQAYARAFALLMHMELPQPAPQTSIVEIALATIAWWAIGAGLAAITASLYNRSLGPKEA